jgi:serine/threonine-protein kinase
LANDDPALFEGTPERGYRLQALVARGATAHVYRAVHATLGVVALKVLDPEGDPAARVEAERRLLREAEVGALLVHPHTARVLGHGRTADGRPYLVMELVEGRTLRDVLSTDAPMDAARVVRLARQIASVLQHTHALGLVHRDLKSGNVVLAHAEEVEIAKVLDFGLVTDVGAAADPCVGSPGYMSPEQIRGEPLDGRSDLYALGAVLYACLTGRPPFAGPTPADTLEAHLHDLPRPLREACPSMKPVPALERIVLRCLAKQADDRYATAEALLEALAGWGS